MITKAGKFESVDAYIAAQPQSARAALNQVRVALRKALPRAEETISYNMPTYKLGGTMVIHFAAWKDHFSLYPASRELLKAFGKDLTLAIISGSTIKFPLAEPVPAALIGRIAKFRVREQAERAKAKKAK